MKRWIAMWIAMFAIILTGAFAYAQDGDVPTEQQPAVESADSHEQDFGETLTNIAPFETWEMLSGALVSGLIIPIVQKRRYSEEARKLIAFGVAAATAIVGSYFRGELSNLTYTATTVMHMLGIVYLAYQTIWKVKFVSAIPDTIEAKVLP